MIEEDHVLDDSGLEELYTLEPEEEETAQKMVAEVKGRVSPEKPN